MAMRPLSVLDLGIEVAVRFRAEEVVVEAVYA
jgi:hypothetical protein